MYLSSKTKLAVFLAAAASLASPLSHASLVMMSDDASLQQQYDERFFSQSGISGDEVVVLETDGSEMPLSIALDLIVPESWKIETKGDLTAAFVSWNGGVAWPHILRNMAHQEKLYITLDWIQKVASVNIPKGSADAYVNQPSQEQAEEDAAEFTARQRERAERRNQSEALLAREQRQIQDLLRRQRESQEANQEYIARLNEGNRVALAEKERLQEALERERQARQALEDKYAVISPSGDVDVPDGAELFNEYERRAVLPFDRSFEYFLRGGHADFITADTPATFVAKEGTVREVVQAWADEIGWVLEYSAGVNHFNPYEVELQGTFYEVGAEFISIFSNSNRPLNITFHPDVRSGDRRGLVRVIDLNYRNR